MFSLIAFQDKLIATLVKLWTTPGCRTSKLHCGKAVRKLHRLGFTLNQSYAVVGDARDMAKLLMECCS